MIPKYSLLYKALSYLSFLEKMGVNPYTLNKDELFLILTSLHVTRGLVRPVHQIRRDNGDKLGIIFHIS